MGFMKRNRVGIILVIGLFASMGTGLIQACRCLDVVMAEIQKIPRRLEGTLAIDTARGGEDIPAILEITPAGFIISPVNPKRRFSRFNMDDSFSDSITVPITARIDPLVKSGIILIFPSAKNAREYRHLLLEVSAPMGGSRYVFVFKVSPPLKRKARKD